VNPLVVGIDSGSSCCKTVALDGRGRIVAQARVEHPAPRIDADGAATQEPEALWRALCAAVVGLGIASDRVVAVGLTTQRDCLLPLAGDDPVAPVFLWMDRRSATVSGGVADAYLPLARSSKARWFRSADAEAAARADRWGGLDAWLVLRITGCYRASAAAVPLSMPTRRFEPGWDPDPTAWEAWGAPAEATPEIVAPGSVLGTVSDAGSAHTGLASGTPLIATAGDKNCEILGAGVCGPSEAALSLGTALSAGTIVDAPDGLTEPPLWTTAGPLPGRWTVEAGVPYGMATWEWMRALCAVPEQDGGARVESVPPGADGLFVLPHWLGTVDAPDARGLIAGLTPAHEARHLLRATLEGLAFASRLALETIAAATGTPIERVYVTGGGAGLDPMVQILAATLSGEVLVPKHTASGAIGAAVVAATTRQVAENEIRARLTPLGDPLRATNCLRSRYDELYASWKHLTAAPDPR